MGDAIHIAALELQAHIGVTADEQAAPQRLTVSLTLHLAAAFAGLADDLKRTVDYAAVCAVVHALVAERPRRLVETLVEEIAARVLERFPLCEAVDAELRKFALSDTAYVAVLISRERSSLPS